MIPRLIRFSLPLAFFLTACGLFSGGVDPNATCYPENEETTFPWAASSGSPYVPGQVLVRYKGEKKGSLQPLARSVQRDYGFQILESDPGYADLIALDANQSVEDAVKTLNADPRVAYAEPNYYLYAQAVPNDELIAQQWNLLEFGLPGAWDIETGKEDVTIAVLDSGVDLSHEDLRDKLVQGCDFFSQDNDPNPGAPKTTSRQTHGTHVAGIAAATGNNGVGVAGVAFGGVKLLPVKVFDDAGGSATADAVAKAIRWTAGLDVSGVQRNPNPARVINLSLGSNEAGRGIRILDDAISDARRAGSLTVVASGNAKNPEGANGSGIFAPANAPDALAVGSVDSTYGRSNFSTYSTSGRTVDLMAPGGYGPIECGMVISTVASEMDGGDYDCEAGTSMAAPFVAGVAALIWSQNPDWSVDRVEEQLRTSTLFEPSMNANEYGAGVLCADRALGAATLCGN